jgi:DNA-3-methyladenine glycosylase
LRPALKSTAEIDMAQLLEQTETIPRPFFERPADLLAPDLLSTVLVHGETAGMLVETEAYLGLTDLAAHASRGRTERTKVMFGPPAHAYVYLIYGMYECLNVVADKPGVPHCVLLRALEPLVGIDQMAKRRQWSGPVAGIANGPGKLTSAMGITRGHYGVDLCSGVLQLRRWKTRPNFAIEVTPRVGIKDNADWPLRFVWSKHTCLSRR